jgi:hypothetical protein
MNNNLEGKKEFSYLNLQANYTKYILYLIVCFAIILIIIQSNFTKNSFMLELTVLIIACFALYLIMNYTYDKFLNM